MTPLAAYLLLFLAVGIGFIFVHLLAGKLIRPSKRNAEKETIYECGEPTIGSAWVQFDLRFYVVALLFVIFDVEVAFFFPWAEVFGKANAIVSAPVPNLEKSSAQDYNDYATKVMDLAISPCSHPKVPTSDGVKSVEDERAYWNKLKELSQPELDARRKVNGKVVGMLRSLPSRQFAAFQALTPEQLERIQQQSASLDKLIGRITKSQQDLQKQIAESLKKLPDSARARVAEYFKTMQGAPPGVGAVTSMIEERVSQTDKQLRARSLKDLTMVSNADLVLIGDPKLLALLGPSLPKETESVKKLASSQRDEIATQARGIREKARTEFPRQVRLWEELSFDWMQNLASMDSDTLDQVKLLSPEVIGALDSRFVPSVRTRARSLSWLAFGEILVFFGVLLVGFAYLWRRGDLAWVRSTAAEDTARKKVEV